MMMNSAIVVSSKLYVPLLSYQCLSKCDFSIILQAFLSLTAVCYMLHVFPRQPCEIKAMKSLLCRKEIKKKKRTITITCFVWYFKRIHRISRLLVRSWPITTMLVRQRHKQEVRADRLNRCAPVERTLIKAEQRPPQFNFPPSLFEEGTTMVSDWR